MKTYLKSLAIIGLLFIGTYVIKVSINLEDRFEAPTFIEAMNDLFQLSKPIMLSMIPFTLVGLLLLKKEDKLLIPGFYAFSLLSIPYGVMFANVNKAGLYWTANLFLLIVLAIAIVISHKPQKIYRANKMETVN